MGLKIKVKEAPAQPQIVEQAEEGEQIIIGTQEDGVSDVDLVDRYLALDAQVATLTVNPLYAQLAEAKKELEKRMAEIEMGAWGGKKVAPTMPITINGKTGRVEFGKRSLVRKLINKPGFKELVGDQVFDEIATVSMADIDRYTTEEQRKTLLSHENSGSRSMKLIHTA